MSDKCVHRISIFKDCAQCEFLHPGGGRRMPYVPRPKEKAETAKESLTKAVQKGIEEIDGCGAVFAEEALKKTLRYLTDQ